MDPLAILRDAIKTASHHGISIGMPQSALPPAERDPSLAGALEPRPKKQSVRVLYRAVDEDDAQAKKPPAVDTDDAHAKKQPSPVLGCSVNSLTPIDPEKKLIAKQESIRHGRQFVECYPMHFRVLTAAALSYLYRGTVDHTIGLGTKGGAEVNISVPNKLFSFLHLLEYLCLNIPYRGKTEEQARSHRARTVYVFWQVKSHYLQLCGSRLDDERKAAVSNDVDRVQNNIRAVERLNIEKKEVAGEELILAQKLLDMQDDMMAKHGDEKSVRVRNRDTMAMKFNSLFTKIPRSRMYGSQDMMVFDELIVQNGPLKTFLAEGFAKHGSGGIIASAWEKYVAEFGDFVRQPQ